jgi:cell division initiation protein
MITPIEIRQHSFTKSLRGYTTEEVQQFLSSVSVEFETQIEENRRLRSELDKLQGSYNSLKEVESMLHQTLKQAEQSTKDTLDNARKRAALMVSEAESKVRDVIRSGQDERNQLDREIQDLCERRDEILSQLTVFLKTQTDRLAGFGRKTVAAGNTTASMLEAYDSDLRSEGSFFNDRDTTHGYSNNNLDNIVEQL